MFDVCIERYKIEWQGRTFYIVEKGCEIVIVAIGDYSCIRNDD